MDHVLFPRFWIEEPALWFAQIEAVFALNSITSDADKYDYILCELPSSAISLIKDLILDSADQYKEGKYRRVKKELIRRISITELNKEEIGSRTPSQFLKYLKEKADPLVSVDAVKEIWLKKLPQNVKYIVSELKGDLDYVCKLADTVKEHIPVPCQNWPLESSNASSTAKTNLMKNFAPQLENFLSELLKFNLNYGKNNTQLESIQAELCKIKLAYCDNNSRLDNIQSELRKIKMLCCNNNDNISLCKNCNEKIINNTNEDDKSYEKSHINESNNTTPNIENETCNTSEDDENVDNDEDGKPEEVTNNKSDKVIFCSCHIYDKRNANGVKIN